MTDAEYRECLEVLLNPPKGWRFYVPGSHLDFSRLISW